MRRTAAILALSLMLPTASLAAPISLSDAQMDLVTAGASATVVANAEAVGARTATDTKAKTFSFEGRVISIAVGHGKAMAVGTDGANTNVDVSGEGTRVHERSRTVSYKTPKGTVSRSHGVVIAIDLNVDAPRAGRMH